METTQKARIIIPPGDAYLEATLTFIGAYVRALGAESTRCEELCRTVEAALKMVLENSRQCLSEHPIEIELYEAGRRLVIEITNHGAPLITENAARLGSNPEEARMRAYFFEHMSVENRGREGQVVSLRMKLGRGLGSKAYCVETPDIIDINDDDIIIRSLQEGEEGALCQLFFHVYEYNYINEIVYFPEKIRQMINEKKLISVVAAAPSGRLVGHLGLIKWNDDPAVFEPCLGLTDPAVKGRGMFKKVLGRIMEMTDELPMQYCFFDFVTNHDYSQKLVARFNPCELALFLGSQCPQTQANLEKLGIGEDPKHSNRFSILYSIIPKVKNPFGTEVILPNKLGEMLGFLLKPMDLGWSPAPRFDALQPGGEYRMHCEPAQGSVIFDCQEPGLGAAEDILKDWKHLIREGYHYAAVEVPLDSPGLGALYDLLAGQGFFIAGFITWHRTSRLGFRFQSLAPAKLDFAEIRLHSDNAKALRDVILEDYERNCAV